MLDLATQLENLTAELKKRFFNDQMDASEQAYWGEVIHMAVLKGSNLALEAAGEVFSK